MHDFNLDFNSQTINTHNNQEIFELLQQAYCQKQLQRLICSFDLKLTQTQRKALTKLWQFIYSPARFFLLADYAGTGKSTIVFAVIKELMRLGKRVVITAPTNKAVEVVRKIALKQGLVVDCITIHQLMGLSVVDKQAEKILEQTAPKLLFIYFDRPKALLQEV
jgi:exodeoxyribonuclease-5